MKIEESGLLLCSIIRPQSSLLHLQSFRVHPQSSILPPQSSFLSPSLLLTPAGPSITIRAMSDPESGLLVTEARDTASSLLPPEVGQAPR
jgi:hypothetical protein